jgi:MFS family permease
MSILRHRGFRRLWAAGAVSLCGDWLSFVAISSLALTGGGGPMALAVVFAAHALPGALLAPVAGALVDRFDRRTVLIAIDVLAALVTAAMAAAAAAGALPAVPLLLLARSARPCPTSASRPRSAVASGAQRSAPGGAAPGASVGRATASAGGRLAPGVAPPHATRQLIVNISARLAIVASHAPPPRSVWPAAIFGR